MAVYIRCAAKINLYLDVIRRRSDGYHDIETLFQPVSLWDELTLSATPDELAVRGDDSSIPWDEDNLCHRAARIMFDKTGYRGGAVIEVRKRIPAGAGLGGGSSDAAATLIGLNALLNFQLDKEELGQLALEIGSDVPFFIHGTPAIGRGLGEDLEGVDGLRDAWILIVKPDVTISTAWAYEQLNLLLTGNGGGAKLKTLLEGIKYFPEKKLSTHNSFERGISERFPEIGGILTVLKGEGALLHTLSGTGAACFSLFSEAKKAEEVRKRFIDKGFFLEIVRPVYQAIELLHTNS